MTNLIATISTAGKIVIATDEGAYPGTLPEFNVRKLETLHTLELPIAMLDIDKSAAYGCGRSTGKLYPLSEDEASELVAANSEYVRNRDARRMEQLDAELAYDSALAKHWDRRADDSEVV